MARLPAPASNCGLASAEERSVRDGAGTSRQQKRASVAEAEGVDKVDGGCQIVGSVAQQHDLLAEQLTVLAEADSAQALWEGASISLERWAGGRAESEKNPKQKDIELPATTAQQPELSVRQAAGAQAACKQRESPKSGAEDSGAAAEGEGAEEQVTDDRDVKKGEGEARAANDGKRRRPGWELQAGERAAHARAAPVQDGTAEREAERAEPLATATLVLTRAVYAERGTGAGNTVGVAEQEDHDDHDVYGEADSRETKNEDHDREHVPAVWDYRLDLDRQPETATTAQAAEEAPAAEAAPAAPKAPAAEEAKAAKEAEAAEVAEAAKAKAVGRVEVAGCSEAGTAHDKSAQRSAQAQARQNEAGASKAGAEGDAEGQGVGEGAVYARAGDDTNNKDYNAENAGCDGADEAAAEANADKHDEEAEPAAAEGRERQDTEDGSDKNEEELEEEDDEGECDEEGEAEDGKPVANLCSACFFQIRPGVWATEPTDNHRLRFADLLHRRELRVSKAADRGTFFFPSGCQVRFCCRSLRRHLFWKKSTRSAPTTPSSSSLPRGETSRELASEIISRRRTGQGWQWWCF